MDLKRSSSPLPTGSASSLRNERPRTRERHSSPARVQTEPQRSKAANLAAFLRCAGAQPQLSDRRNAGETAWWVAFEEVVAVGWR